MQLKKLKVSDKSEREREDEVHKRFPINLIKHVNSFWGSTKLLFEE